MLPDQQKSYKCKQCHCRSDFIFRFLNLLDGRLTLLLQYVRSECCLLVTARAAYPTLPDKGMDLVVQALHNMGRQHTIRVAYPRRGFAVAYGKNSSVRDSTLVSVVLRVRNRCCSPCSPCSSSCSDKRQEANQSKGEPCTCTQRWLHN